MFTGIIEAVGHIDQIEPRDGDIRLRINSANLDMSDVKLGDSIATNGICLTVIDRSDHHYTADLSGETLRRSTLNQWRTGMPVNLEKALLPTTRLGGHLVSGHVDGVGEIITRREDARSIQFEVKVPAELAKYLADKGSITVDGISLTVNELNGSTASLNLVPHTAGHTTIDTWQVGTSVNIEVDVLARYLERLLLGERAADSTATNGVSMSLLAENGFLNRRGRSS